MIVTRRLFLILANSCSLDLAAEVQGQLRSQGNGSFAVSGLLNLRLGFRKVWGSGLGGGF